MQEKEKNQLKIEEKTIVFPEYLTLAALLWFDRYQSQKYINTTPHHHQNGKGKISVCFVWAVKSLGPSGMTILRMIGNSPIQ